MMEFEAIGYVDIDDMSDDAQYPLPSMLGESVEYVDTLGGVVTITSGVDPFGRGAFLCETVTDVGGGFVSRRVTPVPLGEIYEYLVAFGLTVRQPS